MFFVVATPQHDSESFQNTYPQHATSFFKNKNQILSQKNNNIPIIHLQ